MACTIWKASALFFTILPEEEEEEAEEEEEDFSSRVVVAGRALDAGVVAVHTRAVSKLRK